MTISAKIDNAAEYIDKETKERVNIKQLAKNIKVEHISGKLWDAKMADFDGAVQEQLYVFAKNRWPSVKIEPVLILDGQEIIGGASILVQKLPLNLGSIAILKWGPLLKTYDENREKNYAKCIAALLDEYDKKRRMMVSILPRADYRGKNYEYEFLRSIGFLSGSQLLFPNRYFVNLRLNDEELNQNFLQKWRYHLRKSQKENLKFEHATKDRFDEFARLYKEMNERKKFQDHSAYNDTITKIMAIKDERLRPELFFVSKDDEVVAGAIIFKGGECAAYLYGATNKKALGLRAGYFLQYNIIRWLRDNSCAKFYDLGGTDGYQGLHQFKKGMVGKRGIIIPTPPVMNYSSYFFPFLAGRLAFFARDMMIKIKHIISAFNKEFSKPDQKRER